MEGREGRRASGSVRSVTPETPTNLRKASHPGQEASGSKEPAQVPELETQGEKRTRMLQVTDMK